MNKSKTILIILFVSILINSIGILGYHFYTSYLGQIGISNLTPQGINKIITNKVTEEKVEQYVKISDIQSELIKAIEKASPAVVSIVISKDLKIFMEDPYNFFGGYVTQQKQTVGGGSGIIVTSDGYVISNKHVVEDPSAEYTVVTKNGTTYKVEKIWTDPVLDFAVLKILDQNNEIPSDLKPIELNSIQSTVNIGEIVIAIGNALAEFQNTATFGIISGKGRSLEDNSTSSAYLGLYQTDAAINPGNSGGPLIDINGDAIGINTAITSQGQGIGFAMPINKEFVQTTLEMIANQGKISRPFAGIEYVDLNAGLAKTLGTDKFEGIYISNVTKGGAAEKAGIKKGDVITEINGAKISGDDSFLYTLFTHKPGDSVELVIYSDKDYKKVNLTLTERN